MTQHWEDANSFIEEAEQGGGGCLVHCLVVIALIYTHIYTTKHSQSRIIPNIIMMNIIIIIIIIISIIIIIIIIIIITTITITRVQGASRSTAVVLAYLVRRKDMTLRGAFTLVKQRRPVQLPSRSLISLHVLLSRLCPSPFCYSSF
jgi:hypothetical protein